MFFSICYRDELSKETLLLAVYCSLLRIVSSKSLSSASEKNKSANYVYNEK